MQLLLAAANSNRQQEKAAGAAPLGSAVFVAFFSLQMQTSLQAVQLHAQPAAVLT